MNKDEATIDEDYEISMKSDNDDSNLNNIVDDQDYDTDEDCAEDDDNDHSTVASSKFGEKSKGEESLPEIAAEETRALRRLKCLVLFALLVPTAVSLCFCVYVRNESCDVLTVSEPHE